MADFFKVPEGEIEFESFTKLSFSLLRVLKVDFEPTDILGQSVKERRLAKVKYFYSRFTVATVGVAVLSFIINAAVNTDNFVLWSQCLLNAGICAQTFIKSARTLQTRKTIYEIIQELGSLSKQRTSPNSSYHLRTYLEGYLWWMKLYACQFLSACLLLAITLVPYLLFGNMTIVVNYWYPFDVKTLYTFPIAVLWTNWVAWNGGTLLLAVDSLLYALVTVIAMEFDILKIDFGQLSFASREGQVDAIRALYTRHTKLIELSERLQQIYGANFAFNFITSSLLNCFSVFQLSIADDLEAYFFFFPVFGIMMGQNFLMCFFGQKIIDSSADVAEGIFDSKWVESCDKTSARQLVPMIQRAQKGTKLTAIGFVDISLETFTTIMNSAYSYFTFMQNFYDPN